MDSDLNSYCRGHLAADEQRENLIMLNCPYSVLAEESGQENLYRLIIKHPEQAHSALKSITEKLALKIIYSLAHTRKTISLADPYAQLELIGKKRYIEFPASYTVMLLKKIIDGYLAPRTPPCAHIHLCPHTSILLEKLNLLAGIKIQPAPAKNSGLTITGHKCVFEPAPAN